MTKMSSGVVYDVCVVGAGLWGSSTAYHLALLPEKKICLIGPNEPTKMEYPSTSIFGAHYDEGRINRLNSGNITEAIIVNRSAANYPEIEETTETTKATKTKQQLWKGIQFYTEGGNINVGPAGSQYIRNSKAVAEALKCQHIQLSDEQINERYPYLNVQKYNQCVLQLSRAGIINPRRYLLSMKTSAHLKGCDFLEDVVNDIREYHLSDGSTELLLTTDNDRKIHARKVLLCTGAFTSFKNLLPNHLLPDITMAPEQTVRLELSGEDLKLLKDMPSFTSLTTKNKYTDCYIVPPVRYPDGKFYLKIGNDELDFVLESKEDAVAWYRGNGSQKVQMQLMEIMRKLMPEIKAISLKADTCISTLTRTGLPYCDMATTNIGIMLGGNAVGARMAYEMGRIGAKMISNVHWDYDLPATHFKLHYKNKAKL